MKAFFPSWKRRGRSHNSLPSFLLFTAIAQRGNVRTQPLITQSKPQSQASPGGGQSPSEDPRGGFVTHQTRGCLPDPGEEGSSRGSAPALLTHGHTPCGLGVSFAPKVIFSPGLCNHCPAAAAQRLLLHGASSGCSGGRRRRRRRMQDAGMQDAGMQDDARGRDSAAARAGFV